MISLVSVAIQVQFSVKLNSLHRLLCFLFCLGRDLICIQSMDGMLMLFEQESYSFGRFLPGFLLPGPLTYSSRTDSFITVSSSRQVESYKYVWMLNMQLVILNLLPFTS